MSKPLPITVCVAASYPFPGSTGSPILQMQTTFELAHHCEDVFVIRYSGWRGTRTRKFRHNGVDVFEIPLLAVLPTLAWLHVRRRPSVVFAQGLLGAKFATPLALLGRHGLVLEFHEVRTDLARRPTGWRSHLHRLATRLVQRCTTHVVVYSNAEAKHLQASGFTGGVPVVIYPPVDEEFFADGSTSSLVRERDPLVAYAGNLHPWQGVELLLEAMREVWTSRPDVLLTIWGASSAEAHAYFGELDPRVRVMGRVPLSEMPPVLRNADVLTIPRPNVMAASTTSRKLGEYLASGRPLVVTDVADHRALLEPTDAALVAVPTAHGVAEGILQVLEMPDEALARASRGVQVAHQHFSLNEATRRRLAILTKAGRLTQGQ